MIRFYSFIKHKKEEREYLNLLKEKEKEKKGNVLSFAGRSFPFFVSFPPATLVDIAYTIWVR